MASMNSVLQKQREGYLNAMDIMHNVDDMFGGQFVLVQQVAVCNLMNCKHKPGTPIKDHILTMIKYWLKPKAMDLRSMLMPKWR